MTAAAAKPLVVISSRTGNTMILGHAICDAMPGAVLVKPEALPEDLSGFNPILLGFWCDRGMAPEDIQAAAKKLEGKTIGCFATMGGNAETPEALDWMKRTSESLAAAGKKRLAISFSEIPASSCTFLHSRIISCPTKPLAPR